LTTLTSATAVLADLRAGRRTAVEVMSATLDAIARGNPAINAVVFVDAEGALGAARAVDADRRSGVALPPLAGLPVGIKDVIDVTGWPTTGGDPARAGGRASRDAPIVAQLRDAGAIPVAKSSNPLNAADIQTFNDLHGVTRNPWDPARTPGGSSGGAAASVAAGLLSLEVGTDLSGSLRLPAAYCGVASLKPGLGVLPAGGVYAGVPDQRDPGDLLVVGPLARRVGDLGEVFGALLAAAPDTGPRLSLPRPPPAWQPRVALWLDEPFCPPDDAVSAALAGALAGVLERAAAGPGPGLSVAPGRAPWSAPEFFATHCALMYGALSLAVPSASFDYFVRRSADLPSPLAAGLDPTDLLAAGLTIRHRDWLAANEQRWVFAGQLAAYFTDFDVIVCPAAPTAAPLHDARRLDRRRQRLGAEEHPALRQTYWVAIASTLGLPAVTVPVGRDAAGLPLAAQVIAPRFHEWQALAVAALIEAAVGPLPAPPAWRQ
jgi:amidase